MPNTEIQIRKPAGAISLPDVGMWKNRFSIRSETSDRVYVIAQHKESGKMGCSCPSYCIRRYCKHLTRGLGLSLSQIHGNGQIESSKPRKGIR